MQNKYHLVLPILNYRFIHLYRIYNAHKDLDIDYMNLRPMESTLHKYYDSHNEKDVLNRLYELQRADSRVVVNYKWNYIRTEFEKCYAHFAQIALNLAGS